MPVMSSQRASGATAWSVLVFGLYGGALLALPACSPQTAPSVGGESIADPMSDGAEQVRLVGYNDLQGREALQVTARADEANGNWVYVGHLPSLDDEPRLNPITGQMEWNGTSILNVADPANPELVWHIPNDVNTVSRSVSVVYDYEFAADPPGRDYLIRNNEADGVFKFQIFDITSRDTDPSQISLVSEIVGTPPDSCGPGCGGTLIHGAHKGWWSPDTGRFYSAAGEPGFRSNIAQIWDLRDPREPVLLGRAWLPGQKEGEEGFEGQRVHHPVPDEENNRLYMGLFGAGWAGAWDISEPANSVMMWAVDTAPPGRTVHTVSPIMYDEVPNFGPSALPRTYALVVDEALGGDMAPCPEGVRSKSYMIDVTHETNAFPVSTWQVPVGDFCSKGGRFGPHQSAETRNGRLNRFEDKIAWIAYFNAGVRVVDISDPYNLRELGFYIPTANENTRPMNEDQTAAVQVNDVDLDENGLAYVSDRVGTGFWALEYTGPTPGESATSSD